MIKHIHPSVESVTPPSDEWDDALQAISGTTRLPLEVDKIRLARELTAAGVSLSGLDLADRVAEVVELIRESNM